ncbi:hypothetical protein Pla163_00550 [Planctomycetes bacterium Pla163]|uniref:Uncharacterized protein n=1 Tax=Rohdeia mirabilis TaxID=2528008 RepID=A0A518CUQ6_9BACT|nr:hypothetical protein Pla163_00550 [Planctomycetes bacterium Pla163]
MAGVKIVDVTETKPDFVPRCPHCREELPEVFRVVEAKKHMFTHGHGYGYACPHCEANLDFADKS